MFTSLIENIPSPGRAFFYIKTMYKKKYDFNLSVIYVLPFTYLPNV